MISKIDLISAFDISMEKELSLLGEDLIKAHENKDKETIRIILAFSRGLERSVNICKTLIQSV